MAHTTATAWVALAVILLALSASASAVKPRPKVDVDLYTVCGRQEDEKGTVSFANKTYATLVAIQKPVSPNDAVIPPQGMFSVTGDCTYIVNHACKIVRKLPGCPKAACCFYDKNGYFDRPSRLRRRFFVPFSGRCVFQKALKSQCNVLN